MCRCLSEHRETIVYYLVKNIDVLRIQPEGSEVEGIGSKSIIKVLNPGADMEAMNVPHI